VGGFEESYPSLIDGGNAMQCMDFLSLIKWSDLKIQVYTTMLYG
jgi:hypothetical protein